MSSPHKTPRVSTNRSLVLKVHLRGEFLCTRLRSWLEDIGFEELTYQASEPYDLTREKWDMKPSRYAPAMKSEMPIRALSSGDKKSEMMTRGGKI
jgi:hypothetical protein